jgi:HEAT repeat protein
MSLPILHDLYDDVKRLLVAGSDLAIGDASLKKKVSALSKLGEKSPVFAKLANLTDTLTESSDTTSHSLLELSELLSSVMYTMGKTGIQGDLVINDGQHEFPADISYQKLKPILEALTTKGSGRTEVIVQAHQAGKLIDLRLVKPLILALADSNTQLADTIAEKVLPQFGTAVLPMIQSEFKLKGKKADGRRLKVISEILKEEGLPFYIECVEKGSEQVRIAALEILFPYDAAEEVLLEYANAKKPETRKAAYESLMKRESAAAVQFLIKALEGQDHDILIHLCINGTARLKEALLVYAKGLFKDFLILKNEITAKKHHSALNCFRPVPNQDALKFLQEVIETPEFPGQLARLAVVTLLYEGPEMLEYVESVHLLPERENVTDLSLQASLYIRSKKEVFDQYAKYARRTRKDPRGRLIFATMDNFIYNHPELRPFDEKFQQGQYRGYGDIAVTEHPLVGAVWDNRWVDVLIDLDEEELVYRLPNKVTSKKHLNYLLDKLALNPYFSSKRGMGVMTSLIQIGYEQVFEVLIDILKKTDQNMKSVKFHHSRIADNLGLFMFMPKKYISEIKRVGETEIEHPVLRNKLNEILRYLDSKEEI